MDVNLEKQLADFASMASSLGTNFKTILEKAKENLTPEQIAEVDERMKTANFGEVQSELERANKMLGDLRKQL